jgi:hypothetical protein
VKSAERAKNEEWSKELERQSWITKRSGGMRANTGNSFAKLAEDKRDS